MYFIVTVIIRFVQRTANLAAAGRLVVGIDGRLPARYTRRSFYIQLESKDGGCVANFMNKILIIDYNSREICNTF